MNDSIFRISRTQLLVISQLAAALLAGCFVMLGIFSNQGIELSAFIVKWLSLGPLPVGSMLAALTWIIVVSVVLVATQPEGKYAELCWGILVLSSALIALVFVFLLAEAAGLFLSGGLFAGNVS